MSRRTTPQRRTLVRARSLAGFRAGLADLALTGPPLAARRRAVIVPTRASAELLRQTIERAAERQSRPAVFLPDFLTRQEWLAVLHAALGESGDLLSRADREVLFERAARETVALRRLPAPPFELRPGLIAAALDFYDELKRRQRDVRRFVRTLFKELGGVRGLDRGSDELIAQTIFLGFTFLAYERGLAAAGAWDEHALRRRLLEAQPRLPFDHLVIAVADHPSDPRGLWPADFDLLGRLIHLDRIDVVMTDETHDAGLRERLEHELLDATEVRAPDEPPTPRLVAPEGRDDLVFVGHDREEELRGVARAIRARATASGDALAEPVAVVFARPLPYLYLSQHVLADARVPYQTFDALPLASEPYAALVDVVMTVARTGGTRESVVALLRSPHLVFDVDGVPLGGVDVAALGAALAARRVTGEASTYVEELARDTGARNAAAAAAARRAARAAGEAAKALAPFRAAARASDAIHSIAAFLGAHERPPDDDSEESARYRRARAGVRAALDELARAYRRFDDRARAADRLAAEVHHAIEARTFAPRRGSGGVQLTDAVAARFGAFDHVYVVGLVETEWTGRQVRNIFYTSGLLAALGWPREPDAMRAERAAFNDLLGLARVTTRLSAFTLEGEAIVGLSPMVEAARGRPRGEEGEATADAPPTFGDELLTCGPEPIGLDAAPAAWLALRRVRPPLTDPAYGGHVEPQPPQAYRVSRVDRYVDCPFKYFAENVLRLPEEPDDPSGLTPIERGTLLHELFERFYRRWAEAGHGAITMGSLPDAVGMFGAIASDAFARLSPADRALEEARLLGSIVARGAAERVFELEADDSAGVVRRLIECDIRGRFVFPVNFGLDSRTIDIRGKADRIDVLHDGSLRVIDYKLGRMPDVRHSVQIAVYAHAVSQMLAGRGEGEHPVSSAMYLAFGDDRRLEGALGKRGEAAAEVRARASAFAAHVTAIEQGTFPPRPLRPGDCQWCAYAGVCRKEYVAEEHETAESV